jgi:hypothetical protein
VSVARLRDVLHACGWDPALAREMARGHALRRALHDMEKGRVITQYRRDSDSLVRFRITLENVGERDIEYSREADVAMDVTTGAISSDSPAVEQRCRELVDAHLAARTSADVTRLVQRLVESAGADLVSVRESGGAYFVPAAYAELVERLRQLLAGIGGALSSYRISAGDADTDRAIGEAVLAHLRALISDWHQSISTISLDTPEFVVERRLARMHELRAKIDSYRGILGAAVDQLTAAADAGDRALRAAVLGHGGQLEANQ